jgi:hypothetical protein
LPEPARLILAEELEEMDLDTFIDHMGFIEILVRKLEGIVKKRGDEDGVGPVQQIVRSASKTYIAGEKVVIPLSDQADAMSAAADYISFISSYDTSIANKLRLSAHRVVNVVYVPSSLIRSNFLIPELGVLIPITVGDPNLLSRPALLCN